ncbi:MAG: hypothetical protein GY940_17790 [bacterium]|nr:hypothetical protein [bacterium]
MKTSTTSKPPEPPVLAAAAHAVSRKEKAESLTNPEAHGDRGYEDSLSEMIRNSPRQVAQAKLIQRLFSPPEQKTETEAGQEPYRPTPDAVLSEMIRTSPRQVEQAKLIQRLFSPPEQKTGTEAGQEPQQMKKGNKVKNCLPMAQPLQLQDTDDEYDSDTDTDSDYEPKETFYRRHQENTEDSGHYPLEQFAGEWDGSYTRFDTEAGPASVRSGWGRQPFVQSRQSDFNNARVRVDYDDIVDNLSDSDREAEEDCANQILQATRGEDTDFGDWGDEPRRAATHLIGITQVAEEHSRRTPGAAALARAGLQLIADGIATFRDIFNRTSGWFVASQRGGTRELRDIASGEGEIDENTEMMMGAMSESESDDDSDSDQ